MRRGEIAALEWKYIDLKARTALLPDTKNGEARMIPLSVSCRNTIKALPRNINGRLFNMTPHAISYAFIRACKRAGLTDLHFHDLRHEAITRFFEKGFNVMEVSRHQRTQNTSGITALYALKGRRARKKAWMSHGEHVNIFTYQ
jgi:integrase